MALGYTVLKFRLRYKTLKTEMKIMVYYVLEIQSDGNTGSVIPFAYGNDKAEAESKFHAILSVAERSNHKRSTTSDYWH